MSLTAEQLVSIMTQTLMQAVGGSQQAAAASAPATVAAAAAVSTPVQSRASCGCSSHANNSHRRSVTTTRRVKKVDLPGFTDRSARVVLRRNSCGRDEFLVTANNQYRGPVSFTIPADGFVVRVTASAQLKLGVLKIVYHTYDRETTPMGVVDSDRAATELSITMKSGR